MNGMSMTGEATRRAFLGLAGGAMALSALSGSARAARVRTGARIVVLGAGAAGIALVNRLVGRLDGAEIIVIDPSKTQFYQPGFTLIAAGLKPASYSVSPTDQWLPAGIIRIEEAAAEIDPVGKSVTMAGGTRVPYDFLVVATGLKLDWEAIEGFSLDLVGKDGVGAVYAGPEHAKKTWEAMDAFTTAGGRAVFTRPATEMKCAGAPLKYAFITEDYATRKGNRSRIEVNYLSNNKAFFSVPIVSEKIRMLFEERDIRYSYENRLTAIDPGRRLLTFETPEGKKEEGYDFVNVIPPMRSPDVVFNSPLIWADKWVGQGWVEVDKATLRHLRFPEVFALGDVAGVPKGKTAASVKWQVPVVEDHLVAAIEGREGTATYNGYTSCPMITRIGQAMLVEFDYKDNLTPSFPGIIAPLEELWISWLMKEVALKATYNAMLRGRA